MFSTRLFCSLLIVASTAAEITFESEHVLTICDAFTVRHTRRGEVIPECPLHLPPANDFFDHLKASVYEKKCFANTTVSESSLENMTIERGVLILKQLVDSAQYLLEQMMVSFIQAAEDVSGFRPVENDWNPRVYSVLAGVCFLFFHLTARSRTDRLLLSLLLALLTSVVFYFAHLYYRNWFVMSLLIAVALFVGSRFYVRTWLPALSALTFIHLLLPLSGFVVRLVVEIQLLFGPIICQVMNIGSILVRIVCLIGLYIDEKLLVIKVILLPFYQTFISLFDQNDRHVELVESIKKSVIDMTTGLLSSADFKNTSAAQLNAMLIDRFRCLCVNATISWYSACPVLFGRSCASLVDQTELSKVDKGLEVAGQWLTGLILPSLKGTPQKTLSKQLCQPIANSACRAMNVTEYCTPNQILYGQAYQSFSTAVENLRETVLFQPWLRFNFTSYDSIPAVGRNFSLDSDWIWIGRYIVSFLLVGSALVLLIRAFILAFLFVRQYRIDFNFFVSSGRKWWINLARLKLLLKVIAFFFMERATQWTHEMLQKIRFSVPERGEARLAFNVQGNGTLATIVRSVLGSFTIQSKYCTQADTSFCNTPLFTVSWPTWISLFSLSALYFLGVGLLENKANIVMSRVCDLLFHHYSHQKKEIIFKLTREEDQRRRLVISVLVDEALSTSRPENNRRILHFYRQTRHCCWYRFVPTVIQSMIADYKCQVDCLVCQICFQKEMTTRFRCKTLLFCDECRPYLKRCPCGRDICRDGVKIEI